MRSLLQLGVKNTHNQTFSGTYISGMGPFPFVLHLFGSARAQTLFMEEDGRRQLTAGGES